MDNVATLERQTTATARPLYRGRQSPRGEGAVAERAGHARTLPPRPTVPRFTLTPTESAESLGVSRDFFDEHVLPELRVIRRGRLVLVPVRELERWADESAARTL